MNKTKQELIKSLDNKKILIKKWLESGLLDGLTFSNENRMGLLLGSKDKQKII